MFYVITKTGVVSGKSIKEINRKLDSEFDVDEFNGCGTDFVTEVNVSDLSFVQDKKRLSMLPIRNLYKKDNTVKLLVVFNLILTFILLVKGG